MAKPQTVTWAGSGRGRYYCTNVIVMVPTSSMPVKCKKKNSYKSPLGNCSFTPGFNVMIFFLGSPVMGVMCCLVVWHSHFSQISNLLSKHFDHP